MKLFWVLFQTAIVAAVASWLLDSKATTNGTAAVIVGFLCAGLVTMFIFEARLLPSRIARLILWSRHALRRESEGENLSLPRSSRRLSYPAEQGRRIRIGKNSR